MRTSPSWLSLFLAALIECVLVGGMLAAFVTLLVLLLGIIGLAGALIVKLIQLLF